MAKATDTDLNIKITDLTELVTKYFEEKAPSKYSGCTVLVTIDVDKKECQVHLKKMYEGLDDWASFENLTFLSNLFHTTKINVGDEYFYGGCETCDYGSRQEATIYVKDIVL